jgi:hypothetical protein
LLGIGLESHAGKYPPRAFFEPGQTQPTWELRRWHTHGGIQHQANRWWMDCWIELAVYQRKGQTKSASAFQGTRKRPGKNGYATFGLNRLNFGSEEFDRGTTIQWSLSAQQRWFWDAL